MLPLYLVKFGGTQRPNPKFPFPLCSCTQSPQAKQPSLSNGPGTVPAYQRASFSSLPVLEFFKQAKDTFPLQPGSTSPSWYYKACLPQSPDVPSWLQTLWGPVWQGPALLYQVMNGYLPIWQLMLTFIWASLSLCSSILEETNLGFLLTHH